MYISNQIVELVIVQGRAWGVGRQTQKPFCWRLRRTGPTAFGKVHFIFGVRGGKQAREFRRVVCVGEVVEVERCL